MIECHSPPQGHGGQRGAVSWGAWSTPISVGSYPVRKSLACEGQGQSWPGDHSPAVEVRPRVTVGQGRKGSQGSQSATVRSNPEGSL